MLSGTYCMLNFKYFLDIAESTLQYHQELNPVIWKGDDIKPEIKRHLLKIAEYWRDFANIPQNAVIDVLLTGGNANYNYTEFSDLDVHLLVDKDKIADCDADVLDDYLKDKKQLWALNHDIKIYGYEVELYAQDKDEPTSTDQGVFSLKNSKWLNKPKRHKIDLSDGFLKKKIDYFKKIIEFFINSKSDDVQKMKNFKDKLRDMRSAAVRRGGEFSLENLAFKELRNLGYIDKLSDYITHIEDKDLSLEKVD